MIRFIDLSGQDTSYRFAFFDTITDRFLILGNDQVWNSKADLLEGTVPNDPLVDRCVGLMPDWALVDDEIASALERADLP